MSQPLEPPPKVADPRIDQWLYLAWRYLTQASSSDSGNIIMDRVYRQRDDVAGNAPGTDVAAAQLIEATQIYARHTPLTQQVLVQDRDNILANQIFGA